MVKLQSRTMIIFICIIMVLSLDPSSATKVHNVLEFGANPNGVEDTTDAFLKSWQAACNTDGPTTIEVPQGQYMLRPVTFEGKCISKSITLNIRGSLVAPNDHHILGKSKNWITFKDVNGVSIVGGNLDAKGSSWWSCKTSKSKCSKSSNHDGATSLRFASSSDIRIIGLTSSNSQQFHIGISDCQNVHIEDVHVIASASSPNTDGIHVGSSTDVNIINSAMQTGDDCISIGPGVKNIHIEGILCGPGHGISIGSLGWDENEAGVENVTVKSTVIRNSDNGLRIKTWARPSSGFVKGVLYQDITLENVKNPIIVDQNYCPNKGNCPNQGSGIEISDVKYIGIHGTSSTKKAVNFDCSPLHPCSEIKLEDINITFLDDNKAQSSCTNVKGQALGVVQPTSCF